MFPFGSQSNDIFLPRGGNVTSDPLPLSPPFPYFGLSMSSLYVSVNGYITFQQRCNEVCDLVTAVPFTSPPLIAVYWRDYNTSLEDTGNVSYRLSMDPDILNSTSSYIFNERGELFNPSYAVIVTWDNVPFNDITIVPIQLHTFQAILATDGDLSYILIAFGTIGEGYSRVQAEVGFNLGDYDSYQSVFSFLRDDTHGVEFGSNVHSDPAAGRYLFRVNGM